MNKRLFRFLGVLFIGIHIFNQTTYSASGTKFSVRSVIPENQVDKNQTYFDLRLAPNEKQTIQLIIDNSEEEEIMANVALNAASTERNGLIAYNQPDVRDESLVTSITDVAKVVNPEVTVPAKGSATVDIELQMPEQPFDGVILGGLVTTARSVSESQGNQNSGTALNNEFAYVTGLKISENDIELAPDFDFVSVTPGLVNYHNAASIRIRNKMPLIVKGMDVDANIYRNNSNEAFRELKLSNAEMAPNSVGDFVVDWESNAMQSGTYRLNLTVGYEGKEWVWNEEFTISQGEANEANKNAVNIIKKPVWPYVAMGVAVLLVLVFVYAYVRRRRKNQ